MCHPARECPKNKELGAREDTKEPGPREDTEERAKELGKSVETMPREILIGTSKMRSNRIRRHML